MGNSIEFLTNGRLRIYNLTTNKGYVGGYKKDDIFQIRINLEGKIEYIRNNTLLYTTSNILTTGKYIVYGALNSLNLKQVTLGG